MIIKIVLGTMVFFSYFGGNNSPKFLKDNKEIILVIFVIILLHNLMVVEGLGPNTSCNQCIKDVDCLAKNSSEFVQKTSLQDGRQSLLQGIKYKVVGDDTAEYNQVHPCVPDSIYKDTDGNLRTDLDEYPCNLDLDDSNDYKLINSYIKNGTTSDDVDCPNNKLAMSSFI